MVGLHQNPETALVQNNKDTLITCTASCFHKPTSISRNTSKKAIELGLSMDMDFVAKLNLAGVAMTRRRKLEATTY
jgi:hypothetical protein